MPLTILVVEDNRLIAFSLASELQLANYRVSTAHTYAEAKQLAISMKPDLIIMDINLGEQKDGIDLMDDIQGEIGDISNIYLTGYIKEELVNRSRVTMPLCVLEKPVDSRKLIKILEKFELEKDRQNR